MNCVDFLLRFINHTILVSHMWMSLPFLLNDRMHKHYIKKHTENNIFLSLGRLILHCFKYQEISNGTQIYYHYDEPKWLFIVFFSPLVCFTLERVGQKSIGAAAVVFQYLHLVLLTGKWVNIKRRIVNQKSLLFLPAEHFHQIIVSGCQIVKSIGMGFGLSVQKTPQGYSGFFDMS